MIKVYVTVKFWRENVLCPIFYSFKCAIYQTVRADDIA